METYEAVTQRHLWVEMRGQSGVMRIKVTREEETYKSVRHCPGAHLHP